VQIKVQVLNYYICTYIRGCKYGTLADYTPLEKNRYRYHLRCAFRPEAHFWRTPVHFVRGSAMSAMGIHLFRNEALNSS